MLISFNSPLVNNYFICKSFPSAQSAGCKPIKSVSTQPAKVQVLSVDHVPVRSASSCILTKVASQPSDGMKQLFI